MKRIARKDAYTIGHLYILKDGEVTRKVNCAMMNPYLKRWFTSTFDPGLLKGETYFVIPWSLLGAIFWGWS